MNELTSEQRQLLFKEATVLLDRIQTLLLNARVANERAVTTSSLYTINKGEI